MREDLFEAEKFKAGIEYLGGINQAAEIYSKKAIEEEAKKKREEEEKAKAAAQASQSSSSVSSSSSGSSGASTPASSNDNKNNNNPKTEAKTPSSIQVTQNKQGYGYEVVGKDGKVVASISGQYGTSSQAQMEAQHTADYIASLQGSPLNKTTSNNKVTANVIVKPGVKNVSNIKKASGGYVGHGIYELGEMGTETVLTAEQTQVLRNNILSNRPNSLISLLKSYNESYNGISNAANGISQVEDNSMVIEHIEMNMNVSKIADDYDAQRAGEQALEKMMQIARKTQAQNRIGR